MENKISSDDFYKKLNSFPIDILKENYLKSLESKINLMDDLTKEQFYRAFGELYEQRNNFGSAAKYYKKAKDEKKVKEIFLKEGDGEMEKGWEDFAIESYKKAGLNDNEINIRIGGAYVKKGEIELAKKYYEKSDLTSSAKNTKIADMLLEKDNLEEALSYYAKANNQDGLIEVGDKAIKKDEILLAFEAYEKGNLKEKEKILTLANKAFKENKYITSAECFKKIGEREAEEDSWNKALESALEKGKFSDAKKSYENMILLGVNKTELLEEKKIIDNISEFYEKPKNQKELKENIKKLKLIPENEPKVIIKLDPTGKNNKFIYAQDENNQEFVLALPTRKKEYHFGIKELFEKIYGKKFKDVSGGYVHVEKDKLVLDKSSGGFGKFPVKRVKEIVQKKFPNLEIETA